MCTYGPRAGGNADARQVARGRDVRMPRSEGTTTRCGFTYREVFVRDTKKRLAVCLLLLFSGIGPLAAQTTAEPVTTRDVEDDGFDDWGLLGLLGLAGLLGRNRKDKNVVETRRV